MTPEIYLILVLVGIVVLLGLGFGFLKESSLFIDQSGHTVSGMTQVVGGRYLMMAALLLGLYLFSDRASIGVAFFCFAFVALFDILIEKKHGGKAHPHMIAAVLSGIMSIVSFNMA